MPGRESGTQWAQNKCLILLLSFWLAIQSLSHVWLFATPWTAACQASLFFTISWSLINFMSVMPSNHLILCCPLLLLPSIFPSIREHLLQRVGYQGAKALELQFLPLSRYFIWPWCWERLRAGGEGEGRRWDGWMASLTQWTGVWANSGSLWWTGRPGILQSMESQSWTRLSDWTEPKTYFMFLGSPKTYCDLMQK